MPDMTRRTFVAAAAAATGAAAIAQSIPKAAKPMRILILGGTGFIGPHQVRYAVARGHKVTVFNRGKTHPESVPPGVERLEGDRDGKLDALKNREWDAVIDNPARLPRWVRDSAGLLKNSAGQYLFISTISVYKDEREPGADETSPVIELPDPTVEEVTGATYGGLKALAEKEAEKAFPGRATIVRPGLIVGPGDDTDRFTYWPARIARGGEVLAPGNPTDYVQIIDARDLAEFTIRLVEQKAFGTFNAVGPSSPLSMAEMLYGIRGVVSNDIKFTWVPASFLEKQNVSPWSDMPVWLPPAGEYAGTGLRSNARAKAAGITFRPLADTARDTIAYHESRDAERKAKLKAGLAPEREAAVLAAWKKEQHA
jgi:2'-hydroxyisoflavone reductase